MQRKTSVPTVYQAHASGSDWPDSAGEAAKAWRGWKCRCQFEYQKRSTNTKFENPANILSSNSSRNARKLSERQEKSPGLNFQGFFSVAEMEGFEPPHALRRLADFESAPFGHLGTSPDRSIIPAVMRKIKPKISRNAIFVDKCHGRRYNTECKRFFETTLMENQHPKPPACRPWRMYNQEETACQFRYPMISRRRRP